MSRVTHTIVLYLPKPMSKKVVDKLRTCVELSRARISKNLVFHATLSHDEQEIFELISFLIRFTFDFVRVYYLTISFQKFYLSEIISVIN